MVTRCENTEAIYGMEWNGMENIESGPSMIGSAHRPSEDDRLWVSESHEKLGLSSLWAGESYPLKKVHEVFVSICWRRG